MTHWGTNTFFYGETEVAVIDPGPDDEAHLAAILAATRGQRISHILVTHAHLDHSPLAKRLSQAADAPIVAFGPPKAGRSALMQSLADQGLAGGGEGVDHAFEPHETVADGDAIKGADWQLDVLHTPGHFASHIAFATDDWLISGDHVMDWASSLVSPPDGDLTAFMDTSRRLQARAPSRLFPGHGKTIDAPADRLQWLIDHRLRREDGILSALTSDALPISDITQRVYTDINPAMLPAAQRNVFAHLIDLVGRNLALAEPELAPTAYYSRR